MAESRYSHSQHFAHKDLTYTGRCCRMRAVVDATSTSTFLLRQNCCWFCFCCPPVPSEAWLIFTLTPIWPGTCPWPWPLALKSWEISSGSRGFGDCLGGTLPKSFQPGGDVSLNATSCSFVVLRQKRFLKKKHDETNCSRHANCHSTARCVSWKGQVTCNYRAVVNGPGA